MSESWAIQSTLSPLTEAHLVRGQDCWNIKAPKNGDSSSAVIWSNRDFSGLPVQRLRPTVWLLSKYFDGLLKMA